MNKVILIGRLGNDPETRTTGGGTTVCTLSVATSTRYKDRDGEWQEKTQWHRVKVFGNQAESCDKFLRKGRQVGVDGEIQYDKWTDRDGNDKYTTEIIASRVEFLGSKDDSGGGRRDDRGRRDRDDRGRGRDDRDRGRGRDDRDRGRGRDRDDRDRGRGRDDDRGRGGGGNGGGGAPDDDIPF